MGLLDLRWNEIGTQGAKHIIKGLSNNSSVMILNLNGNGVELNTQHVIDDLLYKRKKIGGNKEKLNYTIDTNKKEDLSEQRPLSSNRQQDDDYRAKYEALLVAHGFSEKKLTEYQMKYEQEQKKNLEMKDDFTASLEKEIQYRKQLEDDNLKLKEDMTKKDLTLSQKIQDLELKLSAITTQEKSNSLQILKLEEENKRQKEGYLAKIALIDSIEVIRSA